MSDFPPSLEKVISSFASLPGIGRKTAQRLGFYLLQAEDEYVGEIAEAFTELKKNISTCSNCFNIAEENPCIICQNTRRDQSVICVVENPADIYIFEKTEFNGLYHVLGGVLSPLDGVGPDDLHINELMDRLDGVKELIIAINAGIEGETTTLYLSQQLAEKNIKVTQLARGLPVGGHLEYFDEMTISRSLNERVKV